MLRTLAKIFTSSNGVVVFRDMGLPELLDPILKILIKTCESGQLHLIALSLDSFYEVFNEDYFDQQLRNSGAIERMQGGLPQLR